ncbi:MAG: DUF4837 family protein [Flavobacteriales bacterium]|nr:DUF4837 family protein [Flavobacteriales bacterium]
MTMHKLIFPAILFIAVALSGCDGETTRRLPRHSGESGEVLLVMSDELWHGPEGDSIRQVFETYVPQLPQAEPRFSLLRFRIDQMSDLLKHHRNIVEIKVDAEVSQEAEGVKVIRDKWSNHQLVFTVKAKDKMSLMEMVYPQFERIANIIDQTEKERIKRRYNRFTEPELNALIAEKFGIEINLPLESELAKEKNNFVWIKRERSKFKGNVAHEIVQGFLLFRYPYRGEADLTEAAVMAARDSVLKAHVPGPSPGSYMTTEYRYPPFSKVIAKNERYTLITDGLWRTENSFMGGPFTCMTTVSNDGNYVVSVSGFVFAPNFKKREYIREIQAVLDGVTFPETETQEARLLP